LPRLLRSAPCCSPSIRACHQRPPPGS
jgi:hypothetical protein